MIDKDRVGQRRRRRIVEDADEVGQAQLGGAPTAARELAPHMLAFYLKDLAGEFHSYYNAERFLVEDAALTRAPRKSSRPPR